MTDEVHDVPSVAIHEPRKPPIFFLDEHGRIGHWCPQPNCVPRYLEQDPNTGAIYVTREFEARGWKILYDPYRGRKPDLFEQNGMTDEREVFAEYVAKFASRSTKVSLNRPTDDVEGKDDPGTRFGYYPEDLLPPEVSEYRNGKKAAENYWKPEDLAKELGIGKKAAAAKGAKKGTA